MNSVVVRDSECQVMQETTSKTTSYDSTIRTSTRAPAAHGGRAGSSDAEGDGRASEFLLRAEARAGGRVAVDSAALRDGSHWAVGLREKHVPAVHQPDERFDRRDARRRDRFCWRRRHFGAQGRRGRAAKAGGHGVPEVEPVSEVDFRERGVRAARGRDSRQSRCCTRSWRTRSPGRHCGTK